MGMAFHGCYMQIRVDTHVKFMLPALEQSLRLWTLLSVVTEQIYQVLLSPERRQIVCPGETDSSRWYQIPGC